MNISPRWGYEHGAPIGLRMWASVVQNLTNYTSLSFFAPAGQNLDRTEGLYASEPRRGGTKKTRLSARFRFSIRWTR
jgi:hypothetical protein